MLKFILVADLAAIGAWCNGSTPAFGAVDLGSNPGAPAFFLSSLIPAFAELFSNLKQALRCPAERRSVFLLGVNL